MKLSKRDWIINIENAASRVVAEYGTAVVDSAFRRYGAHSLSDLASCYANEVETVAQAKKIYSDADGCAICCPDAHRG